MDGRRRVGGAVFDERGMSEREAKKTTKLNEELSLED